MHFASTPSASGSRLGGIGFVAALHVLMIWALADGLLPKLVKSPPSKTDVVVLPDKLPPPPPPEPVQRAVEAPQLPQSIWVPPRDPIEFQIAHENAPTASTTVVPPPEGPRTTAQPEVPAQPPATPAIQPAGLMCPQMGRPELPALGVEGQASFRVLGTVRNGRVVAVELTALRTLGDRRAMRQLAQALEQTVRETYQCGSSNGQFTQDFDFRID